MFEEILQNARVDKFIPKNKFYENKALNSKIKKEFIDLIQKIIWKYKISKDTINTKSTKEVEEIQIFEIYLKKKEIPKNALKIIDKSIPYKILYHFIFEDNYLFAISVKNDNSELKFNFSDWNEKKEFNFQGINLENIYQNIVLQFIDKKIKEGEQNFSEIIKKDEEKKRLEREIKILENKIRKEKQFNKKVELNRKLENLRNYLIK